MPLYRCELLWNQFQRGWTEKYTRLAGDAKTAANFTPIVLNQLLDFRHTSCNLYAIRASNPLIPGDEYLRVYNRAGTRFTGTGSPNEDQVPVAAMVRTISLNNHKGMMYLRGLSDDDVKFSTANGASVPSDFLRQSILNLESLLTADVSYGMEMPTPATLAGFGWRQIFSVAPQGANAAQSVITTTQPIANISVPAADGQPVGILVRGIDQKILPALNGMFRVAAVDGPKTAFTVYYTWRSNLQTHQPPRAYARPYYPYYSGFGEFVFQRFTTHKSGGPTIRSRGRRRAAVSRR